MKPRIAASFFGTGASVVLNLIVVIATMHRFLFSDQDHTYTDRRLAPDLRICSI
ncbi:hypothetical protein LQ567_06510 [Niabella pedocola]|uniref:Uncharacterized protein n=1 Tax=Niabella pedocola TaxID=1752077 RepID=A0ABS8PQ33_9BACT|nr:hypothetical protein [Niabella pedocola]MCD2422408.1 hypothetical protein [Niabella pedocola]